MPLSDLFGLIRKRQTSPDKYLASSVNIMATGQEGALRPPFSQQRGVDAYRSWIYAAANINASAIASLPLRLYAKKDSADYSGGTRAVSRRQKAYMMGDGAGDQRPSNAVMQKIATFGDDYEEVTGSHPLLDLLSTSNPYLNGFDLTVLRILYGELTGNAYLHPIIDEATGLPGEIWPLAPQYIEVIPDEDDFIRGYYYGIDSTRKQVFAKDEVIHFRRPNPGNLFYGLGKVEAAFGTILANEAVHNMDLAMFQNSARPDYAVVVKGTPTGDQLDRFQQQVEERLRGTRKDGNFIAVTGDVQFTPLNFPPKDIAGREEIVEEIAAVFGVPVSMLKANDPNLASAQTGFAQWREGTILPLCRMDEQELNQSLLPMFGLEETHCLAYDNPVPRDEQFELTQRTAAVAGGWRTINEARMEEGREPVEDELANQPLIGGQPLGGAPAAPMGMSVDNEPETQAVDRAASLIRSYRSGEMSQYTTIKLLQRCGWSRAVSESMVKSETPVVTAKKKTLKAVSDVDLQPTEEMARLADQGLKYREEHGGGTEIGVARARDIKNRENLSPETINRMASFFARHKVDLDAPGAKPGHKDYPSPGAVAWMLWGGDPGDPSGAGAAWAERKQDELERAKEKGDSSTPAKPSERVEGSDANKPGSAGSSRGGIEISDEQEKGLKNKVEEHNEKHGDKKGKKVDLGMLKAVYRRGAGAFSTSHRPGMTRQQWSMARVNAFLYLVRNGKPENPKYVSDNDLLPKGHPKKEDKKVYEWPEATAKYRLKVEGLADDFAHYKSMDADQDIREDEPATPAMGMQSVVQEAMGEVSSRLLNALDNGEITVEESKTKDISVSETQRAKEAARIVASLTGLQESMSKDLMMMISQAMKGGNEAAVQRLNTELARRGSAIIPDVAMSENIRQLARARATAIAESVVKDTVNRFVSGVGQTFNLEDAASRLEDMGVSRSMTIARTESARAFHDGQIDAWKSSGRVKKKHFLKAPGACQFCDAVNKMHGPGGKHLGIDQPMVKSGQTIRGTKGGTMVVGRTSQGTVHPNCRCDFVAVLED